MHVVAVFYLIIARQNIDTQNYFEAPFTIACIGIVCRFWVIRSCVFS